MSCYDPIYAYQHENTAKRKAEGKRGKIKLNASIQTHNMILPCGKCDGCHTKKASEWGLRCSHEAQFYDYNSFLTLTYDNDCMPDAGFLEPTELTNFIKRLRIAVTRNEKRITTERDMGNIRYFACGEYGTKTTRPHYHALIFNLKFNDSRSVGRELSQSDCLHELWPHGQARIGAVTRASANYVAQYALKKRQTPIWQNDDGVTRPDPFLRMSQYPPIGTRWLHTYANDLHKGYIQDGEQTAGIPRAYRKQLQRLDPSTEEWIAYRAYIHAHRNKKEDSRLPEEVARIKAEIHKSRNKLYDNNTF